jgi:23S rRNA pseudouridine1911/1915/1917 synthase
LCRDSSVMAVVLSQITQHLFSLLPKSLEFKHPITNNLMSFDSELPDDMLSLINKWRKYSVNQRD